MPGEREHRRHDLPLLIGRVAQVSRPWRTRERREAGLVDPAHQRELVRARRLGLVVQARPRDP